MSTEATATSLFARIGKFLTIFRNTVINILFLIVLFFLIGGAISSCQSFSIPNDVALTIKPQGVIVEQSAQSTSLNNILTGNPGLAETELDDLLRSIRLATTDDRIKLILLNLDDLMWVSLTHAKLIGDELDKFKASAKQVVAYGNYYDQNQYLLASHANAVYMHPLGQVLLNGIGTSQLYYKDLLDKLNISVHVFKVGTYKDFVEPFQSDKMSAASKLANQSLIDALWNEYLQRAASNRALPRSEFEQYVNNFSAQLAAAQGDMGRAALESKLVDELLSHDQIRARIGDEVGFDEAGEFRQIEYNQYLSNQPPPTQNGEQIALITARGPIVMGNAGRGNISADVISTLIRQVREDDNSKALVLRVDSPGGSQFASELIRQELELVQLAGKPVVISMGNTAASGGYWISATADAIVAEPTTITGSIGIFAIVPTFENALASIGVHSDGVGTTPLSNTGSPLIGINEPLQNIIQANVENGYQQFLNLVARGRDLEYAAVDKIAQGRVWTGTQALELGLVDELGSLKTAVNRAAELAEITDYGVRKIELPLTPQELLLQQLSELSGGSSAMATLGVATIGVATTKGADRSGELVRGFLSNYLPKRDISTPTQNLLWSLREELDRTMGQLKLLDDPAHRYILCGTCSLTL